MALYSGVTGKLSIKTGSGTEKDLLHMATWSVELTKKILEVPSFGQEYMEKVPSLKDWSASADGTADFATESEQKELVDAFDNGTKLTASFYLNTNTFLTGDCYVESLTIKHDSEGKADISISLAGSQAVTLTLPSA